ncbi:MAG: glycine cleavage system protein GcvH [Planctomycetes bacterium]|nr:glycine cleavage system protein GcvH [Planctomycetota bacterium]
MSNPQDCKYTESHEWCRVEGDTAAVGITQHAAEQLTDLVYIDLPSVGDTVSAGQSFGEIESVKAVGDLNSPVSGEVVEVNQAVIDDVSIISSDAFGAGWLVKVKLSDPGELGRLMDVAEYEKSLAH